MRRSGYVRTYDTDAGPVVTVRAASLDEAKALVEPQIPLLGRPGYSAVWDEEPLPTTDWHVISVRNSAGRVLHRAAIRVRDRQAGGSKRVGVRARRKPPDEPSGSVWAISTGFESSRRRH